MTQREEFEAWWEEFSSAHEDWRFADSDALRWATWQAAKQAQPERAPLSDEQKRILFECVEQVKDGNEMDYWLLGFEAAERAHGIKQGGQHD